MIASSQSAVTKVKLKLKETGITLLPRYIRESKDWESREKLTQSELKEVIKKANSNITEDELEAFLAAGEEYFAENGITPESVIRLLAVG